MTDRLIDDKIAWHEAKIKEYEEKLEYHVIKRHELLSVLVTIGDNNHI